MRGHIGFRSPRRIYDTNITQFSMDLLTHDPETSETYLTQFSMDLLTHDPDANETYLTQFSIDILTY